MYSYVYKYFIYKRGSDMRMITKMVQNQSPMSKAQSPKCNG